MKYFGAMIAMELKGGYEASKKFINSTALDMAVSLGDAGSTGAASGIHDPLGPRTTAGRRGSPRPCRMSVGLEDPEDLKRTRAGHGTLAVTEIRA